uniref:Uncharacterized protein n=1 Tax=viral metagenome TaxID=1070528 RepID=A0A6M3IRJ3_9ZZZZ
MTDLTALQDQIKQVARARQEAQRLADERKAMYDAFISEHTDFFAEVVVAATKAGEEESKLRELTLAVYAETGEKKPCEGVGIREVTRLEYDAEQAFKWAKEHGIALKLDTPTFEKIAKTAPETRPAFVKVTTEAQATIATNLTEVIE